MKILRKLIATLIIIQFFFVDIVFATNIYQNDNSVDSNLSVDKNILRDEATEDIPDNYENQDATSGSEQDNNNVDVPESDKDDICDDDFVKENSEEVDPTNDDEYKELNKSRDLSSDTKEQSNNFGKIEQNYVQEEAIDRALYNTEKTSVDWTKTIDDGVYEIETAVNESKVVEVLNASVVSGGNVQIYTRNTVAKCQLVSVKYVGTGYYTLSFEHSGKYLDVSNGVFENGNNVWQCNYNGSDAQKWIIRQCGDGYYNIVTKCGEKYLTVSGGKDYNCTNIEINAGNDGLSQKFKFKVRTPLTGSKTIDDGTYEIETAVNNSKVIEVRDASTISGANVQIYQRNNAAKCQMVTVKYLGDGFYTLKFEHSGKYLDVENGYTWDRANVWQCNYNGSDAQKWVIKDVGNGFYNIISKCSEKYLTVSNGASSNCTNIEINSYTSSNVSQAFKFKKRLALKGEKSIDDGLYEIETGVNSNKVLEVADGTKASGGNVQIFNRNSLAKCQLVNIKYIGDGYYNISFEHSNKYLDVANGSIANGTNIWQCNYNGSDAQKWIIKDIGNGYYNIISKCSETYLTVTRGLDKNGTNVEINSSNNDLSQKFRIKRRPPLEGVRTIEDGEYEIETGVNPNKVVEVLEGSMLAGANVQIYERNAIAKCQKVTVKYLGEGYYTIVFKHSGKYLDVANGQVADGTNVWQCSENGSDAQKWIIKDAGNGYFYIISKCSETCLTVSNGLNIDCTNIEIHSFNGYASQRFKFRVNRELTGIDVSSHQGYIDWEAVKRSNVDFAILRCGYGQDMIEQDDSKFRRNIEECERLQIPYGVYLYSYALDLASAESEANHMLRLIQGHYPQLGVWFDMEDDDGYKKKYGMPSNELLVNICLKFCEKLKLSGYNAGVYASLSWFNNQLNDSRLDAYDKWVAQWNTRCTYKKDYVMWQYTNLGSVDGISGNVDMNKYYK